MKSHVLRILRTVFNVFYFLNLKFRYYFLKVDFCKSIFNNLFVKFLKISALSNIFCLFLLSFHHIILVFTKNFQRHHWINILATWEWKKAAYSKYKILLQYNWWCYQHKWTCFSFINYKSLGYSFFFLYNIGQMNKWSLKKCDLVGVCICST